MYGKSCMLLDYQLGEAATILAPQVHSMSIDFGNLDIFGNFKYNINKCGSCICTQSCVSVLS